MGFLANKPMAAGDFYLWDAPNQDVPSQCEIAYGPMSPLWIYIFSDTLVFFIKIFELNLLACA